MSSALLTGHLPLATLPPCLQCDGTEVANCKTFNGANKCICDVCQDKYELKDGKSCTQASQAREGMRTAVRASGPYR